MFIEICPLSALSVGMLPNANSPKHLFPEYPLVPVPHLEICDWLKQSKRPSLEGFNEIPSGPQLL